MLIAKLSWSWIYISWFDFTINIKSISFLRMWLTRMIDALNRINTKNASHSILINTSQIMRKMRTNERQECSSKRRHELRKRYERKFILFRMMMMMKSRFERNKHRLRQKRSRLLEFKRKRKQRRRRLKRVRRRKKNRWLKQKKRRWRIIEWWNKIS